MRTREMDRVIASRRWRLPTSPRERRLSWNAPVTLTAACIAELQWWLANLVHINGCPIRASPLAGLFDSVTECDASDTGFGAATFIEGLAAASSSLVAALMAFSAARLSRREVARRSSKGIEFAAAFPERLRSACARIALPTFPRHAPSSPRCVMGPDVWWHLGGILGGRGSVGAAVVCEGRSVIPPPRQLANGAPHPAAGLAEAPRRSRRESSKTSRGARGASHLIYCRVADFTSLVGRLQNLG